MMTMNGRMGFVVFPAIDLRAGQVVRLKEGDPQRQTSYSANPPAIAERWLNEGAGWLHVVNLDGAFDQPDSANRAALKSILEITTRIGAKVQFGGGLRSLDAITGALELGVERAVLGTVAVEQPELLAEAVKRFGAQHIAASLDARDGLVQVRGWQQASGVSARQVAQTLRQSGLEWLVFTDIARDGLQTGLNLAATLEIAQTSGLSVIASGGASSAADVLAVRQAGLAGVIVGRALYEGTLSLSEVLC
jgi:phosphoribosylformimino-5-aminoimidazole carboxamide ribotide isomerase